MKDYMAFYRVQIFPKGPWEMPKTFEAQDDQKAIERSEEIRIAMLGNLRVEAYPYEHYARVKMLRLIEERPVELSTVSIPS